MQTKNGQLKNGQTSKPNALPLVPAFVTGLNPAAVATNGLQNVNSQGTLALLHEPKPTPAKPTRRRKRRTL